MDLETAHVSLQFHLKFDDLFETVLSTRLNSQAQNSLWQKLCDVGQKGGKASGSPEKGSCPSIEVNKAGRMDMTEAMQGEGDQLDLPAHSLDEEQFTFPEGGENTPEGALIQVEHDQVLAQTVEGIPLCQSEQIRQPTQRYTESEQQLTKGIVSYFTAHEAIDPKLYQEVMTLKELEMDPISFKATSDLDTLYMHEAMKAPDADQFREAMQREVKEHTRKVHWKVIFKEDVPSNSKILPVVWSMKCKRRIETREVYKHKARLNIGGH
jgi:predicted SnoaL-like aldol condensation-catalyzing enzyme